MNLKPLIAVEGPNGVGKSTTVRLVLGLLSDRGINCHGLRQPSDTPLGRMIRDEEERATGHALALLVAADRRCQYDSVALPLLSSGVTVVTDRHVPSSLVLQRLDGMEPEDIWGYNRHLARPDLTVYLEDQAHVLAARLAMRAERSRFERTGSSQQELELYRDARAFLDLQGWSQATVTCTGKSPEDVAQEVFDIVFGRLFSEGDASA